MPIYPYKGTYENISQFIHINAVSAGLIMGLNFSVKNRIIFDIFMGGGLRRTNDNISSLQNYYSSDNNIFSDEYNGVIPKIGFQLGVLF